MSLITDANFLIHEMRIKLLRTDERGERIISFRPTVMSDDYIRLAAPTYPEMQYCYSPVYDSVFSNAGTPILSSPRTKRTYHRLRKKDMPLNPAVAPEKTATPDSTNEDIVADDTQEAFAPGAAFPVNKQPSDIPMRKQSAPTLSITETSKSRTNRPKYADDTAVISPLHKETVIRSHARTTSSTTFSFQGDGSENVNSAILHPSIESTIDPSPRSSFDTEDNKASFPSEQIADEPDAEPVPQDTSPNRVKVEEEKEPVPEEAEKKNGAPPPLVFTKTSPATTHLQPPGARRQRPIPGVSILSAMIAEKATAAENPFSEFSFVSGRGEPRPITLCVYLPHSLEPYDPVTLVVKPDAIVDDVIGYILYDYVEQKRLPEIDVELYDIAQWVLRIAEDDGEIEDDLPALDRTQKINKVSFDQFALCRAAPNQVKQNEQIRAKLGRSKPQIEPKKATALDTGAQSAAPQPAASVAPTDPTDVLGPLDPIPPGLAYTSQQTAEADSSAVAVPIPSSKAMLTKSAMPMTPLKYFRIRLMTNEEVSATTTIPAYAEMFIGDVLELVSRKRKLDPDEYMLTIADSNVIVPNDTTVDSMRGITELCLIRKGAGLTIPTASHIWRSPNKKKKDEMYYAGTFASPSGTTNSIYTQYKKYIVNRKMPMFVGRREGVLTIDGDYVHVTPPEHKSMFDSVKTTSLHVSSILSCKQSKKVRTNFKIVAIKDQNHKTYDFEAANHKEAHEICSRINFLMQVSKT